MKIVLYIQQKKSFYQWKYYKKKKIKKDVTLDTNKIKIMIKLK